MTVILTVEYIDPNTGKSLKVERRISGLELTTNPSLLHTFYLEMKSYLEKKKEEHGKM